MNRTCAVIKKQVKDTLKNKAVLLQFILFPVIALLFTEFVAKVSDELPDAYFVNVFATMYIGMVPLLNMASIISEEREKKSLRMLIMSNVKPYEYLIGVGSYVILLCAIGGTAFGLIGGYTGAELMRFVLVMIVGAFASLLLGSAVGIFSKNQSTATALAMPVAMIPAFLPMVALFNEKIASVGKLLYTQQISFMINDLSQSNFSAERFIIIGVNMILFMAVFIFAYSKGDLKE